MSERDIAAEIDALAKRIEAIERAATPRLDDAFPIPPTAERESGPTPGPCVVCGYEAWQKLVESGGHLCRVCDLAGRARDAETMEREHRATIADLRQQLSAATAANVEKDRDHEAMEWIASLPTDTEVILWRGVSGQCYCCVGKAPEGVEGTGPTPADAIAAAKSAEGNV